MSLSPVNLLAGFLNGAPDLSVPIMVSPRARVWYVDSNKAVGSNGTKSKPWATIAIAIGKAAEYDTIIIAAGHAEALTATSFAVTKGLTIIGQGTGSRKPTFTTAVVGGVIAITDADVMISNIRLVANYAGGATNAITLSAAADFCTLDSIDIRDTATGSEWLVHVNVATTVSDLTIQNCSFVGLAGTMTRSIMFAGSSTFLRIVGNYIDVSSTDSVLDHDAGAAVNAFIGYNMIISQAAAAKYAIEIHASSTGQVVKNVGGFNKTDAPIFVGEAAFWNQNYGLNTPGGSAIIFPAVTAL